MDRCDTIRAGQQNIPAGHIWPEEWSNMSKGPQRKAKNKWAEQKPKIGRCEGTPRHLLECREMNKIINSARKNLETRRASAMPCKVTKPANPNGSSRKRPCASDWSKMDTKILNSSCSRQNPEHANIESQRIRTTKSTEKTRKDHIADRGHVFMSHYNMVHKPISIPKAVKSPAARIALDKDWEKLRLNQCPVFKNVG